MSSPSGIFWVGPLYDRGGYGNVARNYVRAIRAANIPVRTFAIGSRHEADIDTAAVAAIRECEQAPAGPIPVGVFHWTPELLPILRTEGVSALASASIFETHSIPASWVEHLRRVDQVWLPSRFNEETYRQAGVPGARIRIIPYPIDTGYFHPGIARTRIPGASGFVFLYAFEFTWRKGFDLLLKAYGAEFTSSDDVTLVFKVYGGGNTDVVRAVLASGAPEFDATSPRAPRVVTLTEAVSQEDLRSLYASCDLYISTDRANGWGMPCMEVMAMGRAAATVDWSGSTAFMTEENSLLIRPSSELEPVDPRLLARRPDLYTGQLWPKVSVEEVRRVMRLAFEDRALLREKGEKAAEHIREHFTFESIGERFREVLNTFPDLASPRGKEPRARLVEPLQVRARLLAGRIRRRVFGTRPSDIP